MGMNKKHTSTMTNTSNASQTTTMADQFQAQQTRIERKQKENECRSTHCSSKLSS